MHLFNKFAQCKFLTNKRYQVLRERLQMSSSKTDPASDNTSSANAHDYRQRIKHSTEKATKYQHRKAHKHRKEMALIERALQKLDAPQSFLDAPCGVGRASVMLERKGFKVTGVDLGEGALQAAQAAVKAINGSTRIERADLEDLPYADRSFDACLCFRFIHHLPSDDLRDRVIVQLCRVSERYVLISYLSPLSVTSFRRALAQRFLGKTSVQYRTSLATLERHFQRQGFTLLKDFAQMPLIHSLHLAIFERHSPTSDPQ